MKIKVLIADNDTLLSKEVMYSLEEEYYEIDNAHDGDLALKKIKRKKYDIIILDKDVPKKDGFQVCKEIREFSLVPIIMLTGKGEDISKIMALEFGSDDCISKPFNVLELKARIKAILRRIRKPEEWNLSPEFEIGEFKINTLGRKISYKKEDINLTGKEFDLFLFLARNPNKTFNREQLLEKIWGYEYYGDLRTVDVHIRRLREKIEKNSSNPKYIITKWGEGYYFKGI